MSIAGILSSSFLQNQLSGASSPYQKDMQQLSQALQSGNLSAAQKDFSAIQQDLQNQGVSSTNHLHHHHHRSVGSGDSSTQNSLIQDLNQVGQALTSGNLSGAQQAYATLQQQLQQFALGGGALSTSQSSTLLAQPPVSLET